MNDKKLTANQNQSCCHKLKNLKRQTSVRLRRYRPSTPECTLDDGAGRHVSLRPPPIPLVYNMANLIGVDPSMHSFVYYFVIDLAILQKYYVLTLES